MGAVNPVTMRRVLMALALLPLVVASWVNFGRGVGLDQDGQAILDVVGTLRAGQYVPSRTSGYPLYEYVAAVVQSVTALQVLSLALTAATLVLLAVLIRPQDSWLRLAAWATYALLPGTVANATSVLEVPLFALLIVVMLWVLLNTGSRWWLAVVAALVVLARPDGALVVLASAVAFGLWRRERRAGGPLVVGTVVAALVVVGLNRGVPDSGLLTEPLLRTFGRAAVSLATISNTVGLIGLAMLLLGLVLTWRDEHAFYGRWLLLVLAVVLARFLLLPDELDYVVGGLLVLLVLAPRLVPTPWTRWGAGIALAGIASTSVVTLALFQRTDPWATSPSPRPSLNSGGIMQDVASRRAETIRNTAGYQAWLDPQPGDLILPRDMWYQVLAARFAADYSSYARLLGCQGLTSRSEPPGWRLSQPAGTFADVEEFETGTAAVCEPVAVNGAGGWVIGAAGP